MAVLTNLRVLRNFLFVCDAPSLAVAAVRANLSQPALSKQMAALEAELGVALLERHARGVRTTHAGAALRDRAAGLLRDADRVADEVAAVRQDISGEVALAVVSSLRDPIGIPTVSAFLVAHPAVSVRILEGTSLAMREAVVSGRADLAIIATPEDAAPLRLKPFAVEPLLAVAPVSAGLRADRPLRLEELARQPLVLVSSPNSIRTLLDAALARRGLRAMVRAEVENAATAMSLLRLGVGWTVFTYAAVMRNIEAGEVCAAPLARLRIGWALATARDRRASAAVRALAAALETSAGSLLASGRWRMASALPDRQRAISPGD